MKTVLTIAGSDPSGGAGIQADMKTFAAHGLYGMSVITALTAQNTLGVRDVFPVPPDFFEKQLEAVLSDIPPDAVKIGMMPDADIIEITVGLLEKYSITNIVTDTVMVSTSGRRLMDEKAVDTLKNRLLCRSRIITPNIPEAEVLWGNSIITEENMKAAARDISLEIGGAVLVKGGHMEGSAADILYCGDFFRFESERINNPNTHGTGCTLSSAITCGLATGLDIPQSVGQAKEYLTAAIRAGLDLGHGIGPLNHIIK
ncbi:MAG: bifunctional hydroxymethylpyrimidine kinase/phosphomethylpyrimidine kinase [Oscillospiraceae bacterium]|nr:bifunctional hydroxymethylpyrimidine kinase/phosphomethylpyrimidine kinase [Oscillospiraceae bacterium]